MAQRAAVTAKRPKVDRSVEKRLSLDIPVQVHQRIRIEAVRRQRTVAEVVRQALVDKTRRLSPN